MYLQRDAGSVQQNSVQLRSLKRKQGQGARRQIRTRTDSYFVAAGGSLAAIILGVRHARQTELRLIHVPQEMIRVAP